MHIIDIIIFVVFIVGIVLFGASFYKKERTSEDFSTGGGVLPAWAIGLSIFATFVSSISFLALPGAAYLSDWNSFVFSLSIPVAIFMAIIFLSRYIEKWVVLQPIRIWRNDLVRGRKIMWHPFGC